MSIDHADLSEATRSTEAVFARRMEVARRMFAGEASYDDVLAFHADDFIWVTSGRTIQGHDAARDYAAQRMARIPADAMKGIKILETRIVGEYAFHTFKTSLIPFGTDTFLIRDGKVVFQSNAIYVPRQVRESLHVEGARG